MLSATSSRSFQIKSCSRLDASSHRSIRVRPARNISKQVHLPCQVSAVCRHMYVCDKPDLMIPSREVYVLQTRPEPRILSRCLTLKKKEELMAAIVYRATFRPRSQEQQSGYSTMTT